MTRFALAVLVGLGLALQAAAGPDGFRAGFASRVVTPPVPDRWSDENGDGRYERGTDAWIDGDGDGRFARTWMAGFAQGRPAAGVHDDLMAVAAVFDDGRTRVGLVTADVIGLSHAFTDALRVRIAGELRLDYLLVHATHNHQGPDTLGLWGPSTFRSGRDDAYLAWLQEQMAAALSAASDAARPARLEIATIRGACDRQARG